MEYYIIEYYIMKYIGIAVDDDDSNSGLSTQGQRQGVTNMLVEHSLHARHTYRQHACNAACLTIGTASDDPAKFRGSNPLHIPQLCGWER